MTKKYTNEIENETQRKQKCNTVVEFTSNFKLNGIHQSAYPSKTTGFVPRVPGDGVFESTTHPVAKG